MLMSAVDEAAINYLHELLSEPNQTLITAAMRRYQSDSKNRLTAFYDVLNARIAGKQKEYDTLLKNLSSGVLPSDVVSDIGQRMRSRPRSSRWRRQSRPKITRSILSGNG